MREVTQALLEMLRAGQSGALATVITTRGSTPQVPGARLLLQPGGSTVGTVGGGAIERLVLEALSDVQEHGQPRVLACDLAKELGMCCGGSMEIFIEPVRGLPRLAIFGAGHVAQPTAALALGAGFEVVVIDERDELNTVERFPGCRRESTDVAAALRALEPGERDWLLIVTHDHRIDEEALRLALLGQARYIGLVGSRRKVYRLLQRVTAREGPLDLSRIYAPVGLNIGAVTPAEIAVSIVAELIALRHRVEATGHMRAVNDTRLGELLAEYVRDPSSGDGSSEAIAADAESVAREGDAPLAGRAVRRAAELAAEGVSGSGASANDIGPAKRGALA